MFDLTTRIQRHFMFDVIFVPNVWIIYKSLSKKCFSRKFVRVFRWSESKMYDHNGEGEDQIVIEFGNGIPGYIDQQ